MIKTLYSEINYGDMVELFYDTNKKNYILIINNKKLILNNKGVWLDMDIKNIDLDYLDTEISNFDITDDINNKFEDWINIDNFIDFLKREGIYDNMKDTIDMYMRFYHKEDKEEVESYSNELEEEVINFFKDSVNESIVESEDE